MGYNMKLDEELNDKPGAVEPPGDDPGGDQATNAALDKALQLMLAGGRGGAGGDPSVQMQLGKPQNMHRVPSAASMGAIQLGQPTNMTRVPDYEKDMAAIRENASAPRHRGRGPAARDRRAARRRRRSGRLSPAAPPGRAPPSRERDRAA